MGSNRLFPFSTVVFASWDYHLTDAAAARNLRHSIRNQLKEMVNDAVLADKIEDTRTKVKAYIRKVPTHLACVVSCLQFVSSSCSQVSKSALRFWRLSSAMSNVLTLPD